MNNTELIQALSLEKIAMYLTSKGWKKKKEAEGIASIWRYASNGREVSILLPIDKEFGDFEIKMEDLILLIAEVESRPQSEILNTLSGL